MDTEVLQDAKRTIGLLRDTVTVLSRELTRAEDSGAGKGLTLEAEKTERSRIEKELVLRDSMIAHLKEENATLQQRWNDAALSHGRAVPYSELTKALSFYYRDFEGIDRSKLTAEDAERLYEVLKYVFEKLKSAGIDLR